MIPFGSFILLNQFTMKAWVNTQYGSPEVLQLKEVTKPVPKENEVLIKIKATTVNRTDCGFRAPEYFIIRLINGFFKPRRTILGSEFSGVVEDIGSKVTLFKKGDHVFGLSTYDFGTHAEFLKLKESASVALMPVNLNFNEAASVSDGLMLAKNIIRKLDFTKAKKILINGATGSIGSAVLQLAKLNGAQITAVCNEVNFQKIKELGATNVIDYTKIDFTNCGDKFDAVIDAVGKSSFFKCKKILNPGGVYMSTELGYLSQNVFLPFFTSFGSKKVHFPIPTDNKNDILYFKKLIEEGNFKPVIDRTYSFNQIIEATKFVETATKFGNVVIEIND